MLAKKGENQPFNAKANKNAEFVKRKEQNAEFVSFHCQTQMAKAEFKGFVVKIQTTKHEKSKLTRFILP